MLGSHRGINASLSRVHGRLKLFDITRSNNVGVALPQFLLGPQFVNRLLQVPLGLLNLALGGQDVGFSGRHPRLHFDNAAASARERGFLPGAVQLEQTVALFHMLIIADIDLRHPTTDLGIYRNGSEQGGDVG